jgi:hypothetical protein
MLDYKQNGEWNLIGGMRQEIQQVVIGGYQYSKKSGSRTN